jgi:peptide/nickel transport system permease protein
MKQYIAKRLIQSLIILFLFLTAVFFLTQIIMPGDFAIIAGFGQGVGKVNELRQEVGLDMPMWQRYLNWLVGLLKGDMGRSFYESPDFRFPGGGVIRMPVAALVGRGLLISLFLFGLGTLIAFLIGSRWGKIVAWRKPNCFTGVSMFFAIVLYTAFPPLIAWSVTEINRSLGLFRLTINVEHWREHYLQGPLWRPSTFAALMFVTLLLLAGILILINYWLGRQRRRGLNGLVFFTLLVTFWVGGWFAIGAGTRFMDIVRFLGLGVIVYVLLSFGETMLIMQTSMTDTLYEEYITVARAKGLPEETVRDRHAARNALLPVLSRLIVSLPYLLTGLVMVEDAIGTGGMGSVLFESLSTQDIPVVMGALVIIGIIALVARLSLEIAIAYLDPRIRVGQASSGTSRAVAEFRGEGFIGTIKTNLPAWLRPGQSQMTGLGAASESPRPNPRHMDVSTWWRLLVQHLRSSLRSVKDSWGVFLENRLAVLGLALILIYTVMAFIHPVLMKSVWNKNIYDPAVGYDPKIFPHPSFPTKGHLLGTDALGRDVLSMLLAATAPTMTVALAAAITAAVVGTLIGAFSAYYHETVVDTIFRYLSDLFLIMPAPIVMVIIGARYYESLSAFNYGLLYGIIAGASSVAIVMRSQALTIMVKPFIAASWVAGAGGRRIVFSHLIPHMLPLASVQMMITVAGAVISYGFIAFVGVSHQTLNWGAMVYDAFMFSMSALGKTPWLQLVSPALALSLFAAAFYFVSRGLHEVAEPRLRKR